MKMDMEKLKKIGYGVVCFVMVAIILWLFIGMMLESSEDKKEKTSKELQRPTPLVTQVVVTKEVDKFVEIEKVISSETIQEGLREMGVLITEEYYFTQVEDYSKTKTLFKFITTESGFVYSYDGVISAGVDFNEIVVKKYDNEKKISIVIPKSAIQYVDIDYDSFKKYEEKESAWNKLALEDYNISMMEFENAAKSRAIERGILMRADEGAQKIISNFVKGLVGEDYTIDILVKQ